jgi:hypothetical protein
MVIALCSLGLSIYVAYLAQRHDRLSVRPYFAISFYYDKNGVSWYGFNSGLGPARIRGFKVLVNGIAQKQADMSVVIRNAFQLPQTTRVTFFNLYAGGAVRAGDTTQLAWVPYGAEARKIYDGENKITFEVCYCSIYEECWLYSTTGPLEGNEKRFL